MTEQWYNCILQRKVDGKEIKARCVDGKYYDVTGAQLIASSYRVIELKEDYEDDGALVPVVDDNEDYVHLAIGLIIVLGLCALIGTVY